MSENYFQGHVAVFAYDIIGFTRFDQAGQRIIKALANRVLDTAKRNVGLTVDQTYYQDAGDGGYLLIRTDARKALDVLEAFCIAMAAEKDLAKEEYHADNRYALHYDTIIVESEGSEQRFLGDAINNCARLLSGMRKDLTEQAVCSGAFRDHVTTFGIIDARLFARLKDIVDKHGNHHEVWNLYKSPGYGIPALEEDRYVPPR